VPDIVSLVVQTNARRNGEGEHVAKVSKRAEAYVLLGLSQVIRMDRVATATIDSGI
jgi:hypothetical protein